MSTPILLPKLGNSVESSIIAAWLKQPGEAVAEGDVVCTVETDKTTMEVVSPAAGVLLAQLAKVGDDVPVQTVIAYIGAEGESAEGAGGATSAEGVKSAALVKADAGAVEQRGNVGATGADEVRAVIASPRARALATERGVALATIIGSGPGGRIIERDVLAARSAPSALPSAPSTPPSLTPVARAMVESGAYVAPARGTGPGGVVTKDDLTTATASAAASAAGSTAGPAATSDDGAIAPLSNLRKIIAERMRDSLHNAAQLTMHANADARAMQAYRARLKASDAALGLREITINDLMLFAVARTLPRFPELNATFKDGALMQYAQAHLAFAVDTPRGLLVPVIRNAGALTLRALSEQARVLSAQCRDGKIAPAALSGGTFTVTNLGGFGIESFTPIINAPQVAILGVGNINLKPLDQNGTVQFIPHLGLSLTIDHQIVDGAPAAKFLHALAHAIGSIDLLVAL
jgi:pyruvate dehydrogenase E2 component (dihydrolipoamide acetyltransferase)